MTRLISSSSLAAVALLCAATTATAQSPASSPSLTQFGQVTAVGKSRSYRVSPRHRIHIQVAGVGTLTGPRGAVTRSGRLRVQRYRGTRSLVTPAGLGIDVTFSHTRLRRPLTLAQRAGRRPVGSMPMVAHRRHDGSWDLKPARLDRHGRMVITTKTFSINLPSWLNPKAWVEAVGGFIAREIGGRTSPVSCPRPAPSWLQANNLTVTAHVCGQDNPDDGGERAEVRIKNNRNTVQQVTLAGNRAYVYVEGQPDPLRRAIGALTGTNPANTVFLSPGDGGYMTVGYRRPGTNADYTMLVQTTYRSVLLDLTYIVIDLVSDEVDDKVKWVAAVRLGQKCLGAFDLPNGTFKNPRDALNATDFGQVFTCVVKAAGEELVDPKKAFNAALELTDGKLERYSTRQLSDQLTKVGGKLQTLGVFLKLLPLLQQTVQGPIDVWAGELVNNGRGTNVDVHLTGRLAAAAGSTGGSSTGGGASAGSPSTGGGGSTGGGQTGGGSTGGGSSPTPAAQTWAETTGGETHTWTNWTNAGGYEGPVIPTRTTVQIACKLQGFRVADGNTWWYRIAQSPWNSSYYASADAFYNNGATSGPLKGTPFVDGAVRDC